MLALHSFRRPDGSGHRGTMRSSGVLQGQARASYRLRLLSARTEVSRRGAISTRACPAASLARVNVLEPKVEVLDPHISLHSFGLRTRDRATERPGKVNENSRGPMELRMSSTALTELNKIEASLWEAADQLRAN